MMPRPAILFLIAALCALPPLAGCAPDPAATPEAESAAAKRTVDKATDLQKQSEQNVKEGNAVLDGK